MSTPTGPRLAIVHDWLTGMRGGEKVLDAVCGRFPDAELFTLVHVRGSVSPAIERLRPHASFVQHLPFVKRMYRAYLPLFPAAVEQVDLTAAAIGYRGAAWVDRQRPALTFAIEGPGRAAYRLETLASGSLVRLLREHEPADAPIHLVYPDGRHPPPKLRAFIEFVAPRLRERSERIARSLGDDA